MSVRIKMPRKSVKYSYDPLSLIELIEQRPSIWDKATDDYKDRFKKTKAWTEVYQLLIEDFEVLNQEEQMEAGKAIKDKWKHIRDAFATSLKKKSPKKYIYFDQLQFLLNILENDDTESILWDTTEDQQSDDEESAVPSQTRNPATGPSFSCTRKRKKFSEINEIDRAALKALEAASQPLSPPPPEVDEDGAFFTSLTSAVKSLTEDEKLEFRVGVLTLIKQIKEKRCDRQVGPSSSSAAS